MDPEVIEKERGRHSNPPRVRAQGDLAVDRHASTPNKTLIGARARQSTALAAGIHFVACPIKNLVIAPEEGPRGHRKTQEPTEDVRSSAVRMNESGGTPRVFRNGVKIRYVIYGTNRKFITWGSRWEGR